jgi:hypothetical protein
LSEAGSPGIKRLILEADHTSPFNAKVNNVWSYTSIPLDVFMAWYLIKYRYFRYINRVACTILWM